MKRFFTLGQTGCALIAAVVLGFVYHASAVECVPFKGDANAVVTGAVPGPDGLHLTLTGTGKATHLGRFTREESVVIHGDGTIEGTIVFIAANGDQLNAAVVGGFISPTTAVGTYLFNGGTGRFANATGSSDFVGVTTDGVHLALTFTGNIAY